MWAPIDFQSIVVVAFAAAGIRYQHKTTHVSMNRRPYCNGCTIKKHGAGPAHSTMYPCKTWPATRLRCITTVGWRKSAATWRDCGTSLQLIDVRAPRRAATAVNHFCLGAFAGDFSIFPASFSTWRHVLAFGLAAFSLVATCINNSSPSSNRTLLVRKGILKFLVLFAQLILE